MRPPPGTRRPCGARSSRPVERAGALEARAGTSSSRRVAASSIPSAIDGRHRADRRAPLRRRPPPRSHRRVDVTTGVPLAIASSDRDAEALVERTDRRGSGRRDRAGRAPRPRLGRAGARRPRARRLPSPASPTTRSSTPSRLVASARRARFLRGSTRADGEHVVAVSAGPSGEKASPTPLGTTRILSCGDAEHLDELALRVLGHRDHQPRRPRHPRDTQAAVLPRPLVEGLRVAQDGKVVNGNDEWARRRLTGPRKVGQWRTSTRSRAPPRQDERVPDGVAVDGGGAAPPAAMSEPDECRSAIHARSSAAR